MTTTIANIGGTKAFHDLCEEKGVLSKLVTFVPGAFLIEGAA